MRQQGNGVSRGGGTPPNNETKPMVCCPHDLMERKYGTQVSNDQRSKASLRPLVTQEPTGCATRIIAEQYSWQPCEGR